MKALKRILAVALPLGLVALVVPPALAQVRGAAPRGPFVQAAPPVHVPPVTGSPAPATLRSPFPAGLPPPIVPGSPGTQAVVNGVLVDTAPPPPAGFVGGGYAVTALPQYAVRGTGPYTAVDIARSFLQADANGDGELTRAEAAHLSILPASFEEMDANHDGVVTRWEYEDAAR